MDFFQFWHMESKKGFKRTLMMERKGEDGKHT